MNIKRWNFNVNQKSNLLLWHWFLMILCILMLENSEGWLSVLLLFTPDGLVNQHTHTKLQLLSHFSQKKSGVGSVLCTWLQCWKSLCQRIIRIFTSQIVSLWLICAYFVDTHHDSSQPSLWLKPKGNKRKWSMLHSKSILQIYSAFFKTILTVTISSEFWNPLKRKIAHQHAF